MLLKNSAEDKIQTIHVIRLGKFVVIYLDKLCTIRHCERLKSSSFKGPKMTNEFTLIVRQTKAPSPLTTPQKWLAGEGNGAVCHMPKYLLQMRNGSNRLRRVRQSERFSLCVEIRIVYVPRQRGRLFLARQHTFEIEWEERRELGSPVGG